MSRSDPKEVKRIFGDALELPASERAAFVARACGGDADLRSDVEALLAVLHAGGAFMAAPTAFDAAKTADHDPGSARSAGLSAASGRPNAVTERPGDEASMRERAGTMIGPYKLLEQIGEGGFGSVFMAEQDKPVQRRVALKIIKLGMDTRQVIARFEAERQALAMMDHPNIARVLDAGATETGRPYFVMELVKGQPITAFCDHGKLSIDERLDLFAQVCLAVQHAHTKGIIHRDIKPNNVLVHIQDGKPFAKVIDFGISKATASRLTEKTLFTHHRQIIGTPEYMSPEQAQGLLDIDTRTDVYSLGVMLYELLTGSTPFIGTELRTAAYDEIRRIIREVEPPKPSTRLSQHTDTIAGIAALRRTEPRKLGTTVRGELDWIVMKALEKDRQRRYETANGLATDVRRYLAGDAVVAAPPSTGYRFRKFVKRNKGVVVSGSAVAAVLLIGVVAFAWQAGVARDQRDIAERARQAEFAQRTLADEQRKAAEAQRDRAEKVAEFMSKTLDGAGPSAARGRDITMLKEMMDDAAAMIENGALTSAPEAELQLRLTIGTIYRQLALYDAAQKMLEPALAVARSTFPGNHEATAAVLNGLALLLQDRGELARAEPLFREALDMRKQLSPGGYPETLAINNLAVVLWNRGDLEGAEPLFREALDMSRRLFPGDHATVANTLANLAQVLRDRGDMVNAEPLCREALEMRKRLFTGDHPDVAASLNNLSYLVYARGDAPGAETLLRDSVDMTKRLHPGDHPDVANGLCNLARLLQFRRDWAGAEPLLRESAAMYGRVLGAGHAQTGSTRLSLGISLLSMSRFSEAEPELVEAERVLSTAQGAPPGWRTPCITSLATLYESWDKAEPGKGYGARAAEWKSKAGAPVKTGGVP